MKKQDGESWSVYLYISYVQTTTRASALHKFHIEGAAGKQNTAASRICFHGLNGKKD